MMWLLGRMPRTGDVMSWENWSLEIVDLDGQRLDKVLASRLVDVTKSGEGGSAESSSLS